MRRDALQIGSHLRIATALLLSAASFALCSAGPTQAHAQPMDTYGMGSRSIAMGGAVTADVEDFSANYYNPAGLVRDDHIRLSVGWFGMQHELEWNGLDSNIDPVHGLLVGIVVPGAIDDFRFAFGLGVHLNDDRVSRTRTLPRTRPRWEFYDNRPHRTYLSTHLAISPWDWLYVGGGIAFLSYSANTLSARGRIDVLAPDAGTRLEHEVRADLTTIRYPQAGIQITPIPELSFGVSYRGSFALDSLLVAEIAADLLVGADVIDAYFFLESQSVNAFVPQQLNFAVSWNITPDFRVNAEVTWLNWAAYRSPIGSSSITLNIDVPPSLADTIRVPDMIVGSEGIPANFSDRVVPRLGVEGYALRTVDLEVAVRGGFFYEQTPVPDQTGISNLLDNDRWVFSAGAGLSLINLQPLIDGFLTFDLHLTYGFMPERITRKASPVDPIGDYRASGHMFGGGLTVEIGLQ